MKNRRMKIVQVGFIVASLLARLSQGFLPERTHVTSYHWTSEQRSTGPMLSMGPFDFFASTSGGGTSSIPKSPSDRLVTGEEPLLCSCPALFELSNDNNVWR